ncbi:MAG TPA: hypothetical protein VNT30_09330 [Stellaceae bacterium]|nr:hypothetical protein [Stellaceae bacterium]
MSRLGFPVLYRVHHEHYGVHHADMETFAGLVTREHPDGTCDLVIFPPNKEPRSVDKIAEGIGPHMFTSLGGGPIEVAEAPSTDAPQSAPATGDQTPPAA